MKLPPEAGASREGNSVLIVPLPACRQAGIPPILLRLDGALAGQGILLKGG